MVPAVEYLHLEVLALLLEGLLADRADLLAYVVMRAPALGLEGCGGGYENLETRYAND